MILSYKLKKSIALSAILFGIMIIALMIFLAGRNRMLKKEWTKTMATVVGERVEISKNRNRRGFQGNEEKTVFPVYEFKTVDNKAHRVDGTFGGYRVTMGKVSTLYYNPKKPEQDFFIEEDSRKGTYLGGIIGSVFILTGIVFRITINGKNIHTT